MTSGRVVVSVEDEDEEDRDSSGHEKHDEEDDGDIDDINTVHGCSAPGRCSRGSVVDTGV